ncbi:signal peptide peptidase SppA [Maioricimonas sp. JC845]|uniref:signal peptide peptidase SppA n=1 Tax=Maioricimonas sp. JC845 TaxID=3232138 RepID=UPI003459DDDE
MNPPEMIVIERRTGGRLLLRLLMFGLVISVLFNLAQFASYQDYVSAGDGPNERFESGDLAAADKIAIVEISGTIMPPFTERILKTIEHVSEDDAVKGVVLAIDSPGGLVADSHQIYHRLQELRQKKPMVVTMGRIAASGGYYVAMGAGPDSPIFVEPTTWTGSIGVIVPRYDVSKLAEKIGVESDSLQTGKFKDTLNPLRPMTEDERAMWGAIIDDAFLRFKTVIADNRSDLDLEQVGELATGQIYTADQALEAGLVDEIGYQEDAIAVLKEKLGLSEVRVVRYSYPATLVDLLTASAQTRSHGTELLREILESQVPRAMYFCGWPALTRK